MTSGGGKTYGHNSLRRCPTSSRDIEPFPSLSKTRNASRSSSSGSACCKSAKKVVSLARGWVVTEASACLSWTPNSAQRPNGALYHGKSSRKITFNFLAISTRNSLNSIVPFLSVSTSLIMSCRSAWVGFCPILRITFPNSFVVIVPVQPANQKVTCQRVHSGPRATENTRAAVLRPVPSPSSSNSAKASRNSAISTSVSWSIIGSFILQAE